MSSAGAAVVAAATGTAGAATEGVSKAAAAVGDVKSEPPAADAAPEIDPDDVKAVAYVTGGAGKLLQVLDSADGQQRLRDAEAASASCYAAVWPHFRKQRGNTACGLATSATLLQALYRHTTKAAFKEHNILDALPGGSAGEYAKTLNWKAIRSNGMTLADVALLLTARGAAATKHHAVELKDDAGLRRLLTRTFAPATAAPASVAPAGGPSASAAASAAAAETFLAVNFFLGTVGYGDVGHHSVMAAYHQATDSVLVLDVWNAFPHAWYPLPLLFKAMNTIDPDSGLTRGAIAVALPTPTPAAAVALPSPAPLAVAAAAGAGAAAEAVAAASK